MSKSFVATSRRFNVTVIMQKQTHAYFALGLFHLPRMWSLPLGYITFSIILLPVALSREIMDEIKAKGLKIDVG